MSEVNLNLANVKPQEKKPDTAVETGGILASNTPSPLFNAVETSGSIASSNSSSPSGTSGGTSYVC